MCWLFFLYFFLPSNTMSLILMYSYEISISHRPHVSHINGYYTLYILAAGVPSIYLKLKTNGCIMKLFSFDQCYFSVKHHSMEILGIVIYRVVLLSSIEQLNYMYFNFFMGLMKLTHLKIMLIQLSIYFSKCVVFILIVETKYLLIFD